MASTTSALTLTFVPFSYRRTIHFPDTDAAGVVFFARYLSICHEAYEEALAAAGVDWRTYFEEHGIVIPIARSEATYLRPLACGDQIRVELRPQRLAPEGFAIDYTLFKTAGVGEKRAAVCRTEHVCITRAGRERTPLPELIAAWVGAKP